MLNNPYRSNCFRHSRVLRRLTVVAGAAGVALLTAAAAAWAQQPMPAAVSSPTPSTVPTLAPSPTPAPATMPVPSAATKATSEQPGLSTPGMPADLGSPIAGAVARGGVRSYEAGELASTAYTVLRHVPAQDGLSAFAASAYGSEGTARQALLARAQRAGGDGVVNLQCLHASGGFEGTWHSGYYCYGNIIKLKR